MPSALRTTLKRGAFKDTSSITNCWFKSGSILKRSVTDSAETKALPGSPSVSNTANPFNSSVFINFKSSEEITTGRSRRRCNSSVIISLICWALKVFKNNSHSPAQISIKNIAVNNTVRKLKMQHDLKNRHNQRKNPFFLCCLPILFAGIYHFLYYIVYYNSPDIDGSRQDIFPGRYQRNRFREQGL